MDKHPVIHNGRRRKDHSTIVWLAETGMKYNWLITIIFTILLMLGFGFKTPKDSFEELHAEIRTNLIVTTAAKDTLQAQIDSGKIERMYLRGLLESSVAAQCLYLPKEITRRSLIPCARLLRERGIE